MNKVKNILTKINLETSNTIKKIALGTSLVVSELLVTNMGFCDVAIEGIMGKILGVLTTVFLYIGILLLCWGIGQLVLAFKNEDADSKSRSIMLIVCAAFLIAVKPFLTGVLGETGTGITIDDSWGG